VETHPLKLFDAFAVVAYVANEPLADRVGSFLDDQSEQRTISAANLAEVYDHLVRVRGHGFDDAHESIMLMRLGGLDVVFADDVVAEHAGRLRATHYDPRKSPLSLADCFALATARCEGATLITGDAALAGAARAESVNVVEL
jgi:uncharacterized protein with PIN domain